MSSTKGTIEWRREGEEEETTGGGNLRDATAGVEGTGGGNLEDSYLRRELLVLRMSGDEKIGGDALTDDYKLGRVETQEREEEEEEEEVDEEEEENEDMCVLDVAGASGDEIRFGRLEASDGEKERHKVGEMRKEMGGENLEKFGGAASLEAGTVNNLEKEEQFTRL